MKRGEGELSHFEKMKALEAKLTLSAETLKDAREIAKRYTTVLEPHETAGYRGRTLELPYVAGFGKTPQECVADLQESLAVAVGSMLANEETPPSPSVEDKRDDQVNIKLTLREKAFFSAAARREGFRSVADFMRSLAMRRLQ